MWEGFGEIRHVGDCPSLVVNVLHFVEQKGIMEIFLKSPNVSNLPGSRMDWDWQFRTHCREEVDSTMDSR